MATLRHPPSPPPENGAVRRGLSLEALMKQHSANSARTLMDELELTARVVTLLERIAHQTAPSADERIDETLDVLADLISTMREEIGAMRQETAEFLSVVRKTQKSSDGTTRDLAEIRNLVERNIRQTSELSSRLIEQQVVDPICKTLLCVLSRYQDALGNEGAEDLSRALEPFGLEVIRPKPGDPFNVHQHSPIVRTNTDDPKLSNRIAQCHYLGLARAGRIIMTAKVSLYLSSPSSANPEGGSTS